MKKRKLPIARILMTALTAAAILAIFYNSSLSAVESTEQSSPLTEMINAFLRSVHINITVTETLVRKLAHFSEYAILGGLMMTTVYLWIGTRKRMLLIGLPIGAAVAVCDELIQLFPAGRSCEVRDMLIDFCGVLFSALMITLIISIIEKRRKNRTALSAVQTGEGRDSFE